MIATPERPRFSLQSMFVLIAIISLPMCWVAYQSNWIRQRHEYLKKWEYLERLGSMPHSDSMPYPWQLKLFGEQSHDFIMAIKSNKAEAKSLFPESYIVTWPDADAPPPSVAIK